MRHPDGRTPSHGAFWAGLLLLGLGVCGLFDAAGIADWDTTIGMWWPLVIVAWAVIDMIAERTVTLRTFVWAAIGVALLADVHGWTTDVVVWSTFAVVVGLVSIVTGLTRRSRSAHRHAGTAGPLHGGAA